MGRTNLVNTLLALRLAYYRAGIIERLRRFKLLMFFILAMIVPTVAFILQIIQTASMELMNGVEHSTHFVSLIIFQLIAMIWIGSQYDCLKMTDVENYLRTLKIPGAHFFLIELLFGSFIHLPFLAFLIVGIFSLAGQYSILLNIPHFIYIFSSLLFLAICFIFSRAILASLLIITNLLFIYLNGLVCCIFLSAILGLFGYFIVIRRIPSHIKMSSLIPISKLRLSKFFPNIYLNLKSLLVLNRVYTTCIFGINGLTLFILIYYNLAQNTSKTMHISFLIALNVTMFFCSLLIYKIVEARKIYGVFFSVLYTRLQNYFFDLITVYIIALFHFIVMLLMGFYLDFNAILMLKSLLIATISIILCISLNRRFSFYGPVMSLLTLAGISVVSRGLL